VAFQSLEIPCALFSREWKARIWSDGFVRRHRRRSRGPKGRHVIARGEAPGDGPENIQALKGRHFSRSCALSGLVRFVLIVPRGDAPGCLIMAFQAFCPLNSDRWVSLPSRPFAAFCSPEFRPATKAPQKDAKHAKADGHDRALHAPAGWSGWNRPVRTRTPGLSRHSVPAKADGVRPVAG
jgi:hypothetical protein